MLCEAALATSPQERALSKGETSSSDKAAVKSTGASAGVGMGDILVRRAVSKGDTMRADSADALHMTSRGLHTVKQQHGGISPPCTNPIANRPHGG